jgi:hypothetical protein
LLADGYVETWHVRNYDKKIYVYKLKRNIVKGIQIVVFWLQHHLSCTLLPFQKKKLSPSLGQAVKKMEVVCSSEMLVTMYKTTLRHNPEDHNLKSHPL